MEEEKKEETPAKLLADALMKYLLTGVKIDKGESFLAMGIKVGKPPDHGVINDLIKVVSKLREKSRNDTILVLGSMLYAELMIDMEKLEAESEPAGHDEADNILNNALRSISEVHEKEEHKDGLSHQS